MSDADQPATGPACFRNRFNGLYKTFSPGDIAFVAKEWAFAHSGPRQCEGQSPPDCIEPGDDG